MKSLQQQLKEQTEQFETRNKAQEKLLSDIQQQNISLTTVFDHANMKIEELEKQNESLVQKVDALELKNESNESFFNKKLEKVCASCLPLILLLSANVLW